MRPLHVDKLHSPQEVTKQETFDALIERSWGTSASPPSASKLNIDNNDETWDEYHDFDEPDKCIPEIEDVVDIGGKLL